VRFDSQLLLILPVFVFCVVVHECAHGLMALWCGDATAKERGRLTLNPLAHLDPVGSLLVPGVLLLLHSPFMLGWAKPVPIDRSRLRDLRNDPVKVALAGPTSNLLLALICAGLARVASPLASAPGGVAAFFAPLETMALAGVVLNAVLALFNLLPIPPLDGSWVLMRFLRLRHIILLHQFRLVGMLLVAALVASPRVSNVVLYTPVRAVVRACLGLFGIPSQGIEL
jgi:Zn-dependent protease